MAVAEFLRPWIICKRLFAFFDPSTVTSKRPKSLQVFLIRATFFPGVTTTIALGEVALIDRMHREKSSLVPRVAKTTVTSLVVKVGVNAGRIGRKVQEAIMFTMRRVYRQSLMDSN